MVMPQPAVTMIGIAVRVRHAVLMCRDFPVLVGMDTLRQCKHGQTAKPKNTELSATEH